MMVRFRNEEVVLDVGRVCDAIVQEALSRMAERRRTSRAER